MNLSKIAHVVHNEIQNTKYTVSKRQIQNTSVFDSLYRFMLSLFSEDLHPLPEHKPQLKYPKMIQTVKQSVSLQVEQKEAGLFSFSFAVL